MKIKKKLSLLKDNFFFILYTYIMMKWSHTKTNFEFHQTGDGDEKSMEW